MYLLLSYYENSRSCDEFIFVEETRFCIICSTFGTRRYEFYQWLEIIGEINEITRLLYMNTWYGFIYDETYVEKSEIIFSYLKTEFFFNLKIH